MTEEQDEQLAQEWYDHKSAMMEAALGKEHDMVMHAIIPYGIGGGLDLYYFPHGVPGVGVATKELCESPGEGASNDVLDLYELVMFTKHELSLDEAPEESTAFGQAHSNINAILNTMAPYSAQATLNPNETSEFPADMEKIGGKCFIFDAYGEPTGNNPTFGMLVVIEVFRPEMDFAREHGGALLLEKLKQAGHYPYSDLDREPVARSSPGFASTPARSPKITLFGRIWNALFGRQPN